MATVIPPIRDDISGTAPNPSNAVARAGFGALHDYLMNLLGSAGTPAAARTALDIKQLQSIDYTLSGNALTLKLNPTNLDFRSTTLTTGAPVNVSAATQLTTTISSGSTGGTVNAVQSDIVVLAINNAGTMELAWTNAASGLVLDETGLITTVAEGGAGAADSATTIYSTTARTGVAYRVVGLFRSTQTTAGNWAQTPTLVQGMGGQVNNTGITDVIPAGAVMSFAKNKAPAGWLKANGANVSRTSYAALFAALVESDTATMTIASPSVVTWTAHGRSANDPVKFSTTGALPTGFVAGTTYYVVGASITTNTFTLSATAGGTAINTTGTQSGVHTAIYAPYGTGDGSTTFGLPDLRGEFVRGLDDGRGVDVSRSIGSAQAADVMPHNHKQGLVASGLGSLTVGSSYLISSGSSMTTTQVDIYTGGGYGSGAQITGTTGAETRPRSVAQLMCIKY
jgi:microcystin-dependent protein